MKTNWPLKHKTITTKAEVQLISTIITFLLAAVNKLQCTPTGQLKPLY